MFESHITHKSFESCSCLHYLVVPVNTDLNPYILIFAVAYPFFVVGNDAAYKVWLSVMECRHELAKRLFIQLSYSAEHAFLGLGSRTCAIRLSHFSHGFQTHHTVHYMGIKRFLSKCILDHRKFKASFIEHTWFSFSLNRQTDVNHVSRPIFPNKDSPSFQTSCTKALEELLSRAVTLSLSGSMFFVNQDVAL